MTFSATAENRVIAERRAAALACMKLKVRILLENCYTFLAVFRAVLTCVSCRPVQEMGLLDKNNNPLTQAGYHQEKVREAGERARRPVPLEVPQDLEERIREYLTEVSRHLV